MIKIGNRELVLSEIFLVKDNEEINIESSIDDWDLKITIIIVESESEAPSITWFAASDNHARVEFHGWKNPLGSAMESPIRLGVTDTTNREIFFSACNYRIDKINRLDFQVYLGGRHE